MSKTISIHNLVKKEDAEKRPLPYHIEMLLRDIDTYTRLLTNEEACLAATTDKEIIARCKIRIQIWETHIKEIRKAIQYFEDNQEFYVT